MIAGVITFGYYYLLINTVNYVDAEHGAWCAAGLIASFLVTCICFTNAQAIQASHCDPDTYPESKPDVGPLVVPDGEWEMVMDGLLREIAANVDKPSQTDRWEPPPTWREDLS